MKKTLTRSDEVPVMRSRPPSPVPRQEQRTTVSTAVTAVTASATTRAALCLFLSLLLGEASGQAVPCEEGITDCEALMGMGSYCRPAAVQSNGAGDGGSTTSYICSNPLENGCFYNRGEADKGYRNNRKYLRACNSDDPADAARRGICQLSPYGQEIRLFSFNWASAMFVNWIVEILLSEFLQVPVTMEAGDPTAYTSFYHPDARFDFASTTDNFVAIKALQTASHVQECRTVPDDIPLLNTSDYIPCAHAALEVWNTELSYVQEAIFKGEVEPPQALGVLGSESWYTSKFTAAADPSLALYLGLMMNHTMEAFPPSNETGVTINPDLARARAMRRKLADTFLRPTTWHDYCAEETDDYCATPTTVASRPPSSKEGEGRRMFFEGVYTGYFRKTAENDCDTFPDECTGAIIDYPCGWSSFVEAQTYYLGIPLRSSGTQPGSRGYSYDQMVDIWRAGNATRSHVMMFWWTPTPLYQEFLGTEFEFQRVQLPPPTSKCIEARLGDTDRCSENLADRIGDPDGVCDEYAKTLDKLLAGSLARYLKDSDIPEGLQSPAYEALRFFTISDLQLNELFQSWDTHPSPQEAICQWVVENEPYLRAFIPDSYPRTIKSQSKTGQVAGAVIAGSISLALVLATAAGVYRSRHLQAISFAQIEFLTLLLVGLVCLALGAIFTGLDPKNWTCVTSAWAVNCGYTLLLVPLIVKVAAINRLLNAANHMKRVVLKRRSLFGAVAVISALTLIMLIVISVVDPPRKETEYTLTEEQTDTGETIVYYSHYCDSRCNWEYATVAWHGVLLLAATVLAFQSRKLRQEFNESTLLAFMVYFMFVFVILRVVTIVLRDTVSSNRLQFLRSLVYSADAVVATAVYFIPKLAAAQLERSHGRKPKSFEKRFGLGLVQDNNIARIVVNISGQQEGEVPSGVSQDDNCEETSMPFSRSHQLDAVCEEADDDGIVIDGKSTPPSVAQDTDSGTSHVEEHLGGSGDATCSQSS